MAKFIVRIDACFNFVVEAASAAEAQATAEDQFDMSNFNHITETLVFAEDGVTPTDDGDDLGRPCECFNCGWKGGEELLNKIKDFGSRVEAGDTAVPAGECPECGCLAYLDDGETATSGEVPERDWVTNPNYPDEPIDNVGLNDVLAPEWPVPAAGGE